MEVEGATVGARALGRRDDVPAAAAPPRLLVCVPVPMVSDSAWAVADGVDCICMHASHSAVS